MFKDEKHTPPALPAMKKRLWQCFLCIAAIGITTGIIELITINHHAEELRRVGVDTLSRQEWVRDSLFQQLGLERLTQDWQQLSPKARKDLVADIHTRQQRLVDNLGQTAERDIAISLINKIKNLKLEQLQRPTAALTELSHASRDLAIRLSSLGVTESQRRFSALEKHRKQLNATALFFSLLLIVCCQFIAWFLFGRHFVRPLFEIGEQLDSISSRRYDTEPKLNTVNAELQEMADNLKLIHRQLKHHSVNSEKDPETGIASRKGFNEQLKHEWHRCLRSDEPISVLLLAPDPIYKHNGSILEQLPDTVMSPLVAIASQHTARAQDFLAHFDTHRLAIILSSTNLEQALKLASQLCHKVSESKISTPLLARQPWISLSVGIANQIPKHSQQWDVLVQEAEEALAQAHLQGGNQAKVAPCHLPEPHWLTKANSR